MKLDEAVELGRLLDIYGSLLTDKKAEILSMYVNDNMSYQEIADMLNISKPAVLDSIRVAETKLKNLESKLRVLDFRQKLEEVATSDEVRQNLISLLKEF
jgi:predicted DNA-binding protein YlxM (UPF0122 family)